MSSYKGANLFGSGVHRFVVQGVRVRYEEHVSPGADGAEVMTLGRESGKIEQQGMLLADDIAGMEAQVARIGEAMDGAGRLVDEFGRGFENMVLVEFEQGQVKRVGARLGMEYSAKYVQAGGQ